MDIITHALSGATFTYALPKKSRQWWFPIWGMIVAVSPDADLLFIASTVDYLTIHRSITHSFAGAWGISFLCALPLVFLTSLQPPIDKIPQQKHTSWSLLGAWFFAYIIILQHIFLDVMNSYGTQIFLPFNENKLCLNNLFIVDILIIIPLLLGILFWRRSRTIMIILLCWTIMYPIFTIGIKLGLETYLQRNYSSYNTTFSKTQDTSSKTPDTTKLYLIPDVFTPFYWKIIIDNNDHWNLSGYIAFTKPPKELLKIEKPSPELIKKLKKHSPLFSMYNDFSVFLALSTKSILQGKEYTFTDLRFNSTLPFMQKLQQKNIRNAEAFQFIAITDNYDVPLSIRFTGTGASGDTGWVSPEHY